MFKIEEGCRTFIDMEMDIMILAEEAFNNTVSEEEFIHFMNRSLALYYNAAYEACTDGSYKHWAMRYHWFVLPVILIFQLSWL